MSSRAIRMGRAFVELFTDDRKLVRGLKRTAKQVKQFAKNVRAMGLKMMAGGTAMVAPVMMAVKHFAGVGDNLNKMAIRTGVTTQALSQLGFAAEQSGLDLATLETGIKGMQRSILNAERGLTTSIDTLDDLGLSVADLQGLAPEDQFKLFADRIASVEDPSRRAALAMQVFGRAGQMLVPLLAEGAAGISKLMAEADQIGLTVSPEDAAAAAKLTDAWNRLKRVWGTILFNTGAGVAEMLTGLIGRIKNVAISVSTWIKENKTLIATVLKIGAVVFATGAAITAIATAIAGVGFIFTGIAAAVSMIGTAIMASIVAAKVAFVGIATAIGALLSPVGLAVAAVATLGGALLYYSGYGTKALEWLGDTARWLGDCFVWARETAAGALDGIVSALKAGKIKLAAEILWAGVKLVFYEGANAVKDYWLNTKYYFIGLFDDIWTYMRLNFSTELATMRQLWANFRKIFADTWTKTQGVIAQGVLTVLGKFQGLSKEEMTEARSMLKDEYNKKLDKNKTTYDDTIKSILDDAKETPESIKEAREARRLSRASEREEVRSEIKQALDEARANLNKKIAEGRDAAAEAKKMRAAPGGPVLPPGFDPAKIAANSASSLGSFSASAMMRLVAGSGKDRVADAVEKQLGVSTELLQINKNLLQIERQRRGQVFA